MDAVVPYTRQNPRAIERSRDEWIMHVCVMTSDHQRRAQRRDCSALTVLIMIACFPGLLPAPCAALPLPVAGIHGSRTEKRSVPSMTTTRSLTLCCAILAWRLFLGWWINTSFDPDEYWQGPEVAHRLVFGYAPVATHQTLSPQGDCGKESSRTYMCSVGHSAHMAKSAGLNGA